MRVVTCAGVAALCLLLTACVQLRRSPAQPALSVAEEMYDRGIAELGASGETTYFETLFREYSTSPWASRARTVLGLLEQRTAGTEAELGRRAQLAAQAEEEVTRLHAEEARLAAVVAELQKQRDRLEAERGQGLAELERLRTDKTRLIGDLEQQRADNARLLGDLEQLKNLTIEMELKR